LEFTYWLQPKKAPVVYIVPGLGSHRLADSALALAELVYEQGFSAVCISSPYNYEFMERASSVAMPAYTPVDAHDLHFALTSIDRRLEPLYPGRLGARALMGYSMGAFHSLFIAATAATNQHADPIRLVMSPSIHRSDCSMAFPNWTSFIRRRWPGPPRSERPTFKIRF
jgi:hypothetical protein